MVDFIKALKRPFSDINKFLIGTILGMIPIVNFTVIGYTLVCTGFTKEKVNRDGLPEWKNYGDLFMKGLVATIIGIILSLPAALILLGTFGSFFISPVLSMLFGGFSIDTWNNLITGRITEIQIQNWFAQNWTKIMPFFISALPFLLLGAVLALLTLYIMPGTVLGWLKEDRFSAAFSWKNLKKTLTMDYLVNRIVVGLLVMITSALLGWIPFIGSGITMYVTGVFSYTVLAEVFERGQ
jgi:hypothetical protein